MDITERKITKIAREAEKLKASKAEIEASFYAYLTDTLTREESAAFAVVLDKLYTVSKAESRASLEREGAGEPAFYAGILHLRGMDEKAGTSRRGPPIKRRRAH